MTALQRTFLRAAARIRERLVTPGCRTVQISLPESSLEECAKLIRMQDLVHARGWQVAADYVQRRLKSELHSLRWRLDEICGQFGDRPTLRVASQREIYEDLISLKDEFNHVALDLKKQTITATTDPIRLEGIYLGPFQIILDWGCIGSPSPYGVVATDPQEAASRSGTTHPHVNDEDLCEGDAKLPIRHALQQGRLFDFFTIIRQTLETYNDGSAYVRLSQWNGIECRDCGTVVSEDDEGTCSHCHRSICVECLRTCRRCEGDRCSDCLSSCHDCDQSCCKNCLSACDICGDNFCQECLDDDQCANCRSVEEECREEERQPVSDGTTDSQAVGVAVHAHRLGQTTASA
ncbi:MAG: hypothetical protein K8T91_18880 [Planctomycetes bacterium]|nr:hypothetical protein [Planctomycetota bacterium]